VRKLLFLAVFIVCGWANFAQSGAITFKVASYLIARKQTANLYTKAELIVDDETQSWEFILYRKDGSGPERIKLEKFDDIGRGRGVFRTVTIREGSRTFGSDLFAYMPVFEGTRITVDLCDTKKEITRRRLILEY